MDIPLFGLASNILRTEMLQFWPKIRCPKHRSDCQLEELKSDSGLAV